MEGDFYMIHVQDIDLEPKEAEIHDYCSFCKSPIYKGEKWYVGLDIEACEECTTEFLRYHRRIAE